MNDNLKALLDREPKDGLEYFRGAMQKLLAPYPGSYDLLGKVVAAFYVYEQSGHVPEYAAESEELYLFLLDHEFRNDTEEVRWEATHTLLCLLVPKEEATPLSQWSNFLTDLEDAWNQHT